MKCNRETEKDRSRNPTRYKIGGVLSNNASEGYFRDTIQVSKKNGAERNIS